MKEIHRQLDTSIPLEEVAVKLWLSVISQYMVTGW